MLQWHCAGGKAIETVPLAKGALRYPAFRYLTVSTLTMFAARWMDVVVVGWLVLELTNSPLQVGLVGSLRFLGWVLSPLGGALADRLDRRRLLLVIQGGNTLLALVLLALVAAGGLQLWQLYAIILGTGAAFGLDYTVRNALVGDVVDRGSLLNALALHRATQNITTVVGAILGGSFVALVGYRGAFGLIALALLVNLITLFLMAPSRREASTQRDSVWAELVDGFRLFASHGGIRGVLLVAALANLLIFPLTFALLPLFARDVLGRGASGLGFLTAALGAGALIGSLSLASPGRLPRKGGLMVTALLIWPLFLVGFALSPHFSLSLAFLVLAGIAQDLSMVLVMTLLLDIATPEMRGRVMGLRGLAIVALPPGNLIAGALAQSLGAPTTGVIFVGVFALSVLAVILAAPEMRRWG